MATLRSEGKFITLEGGEGAGKSTSREFIVELLDARNTVSYTHLTLPTILRV